jgi:hypothetical protein
MELAIPIDTLSTQFLHSYFNVCLFRKKYQPLIKCYSPTPGAVITRGSRKFHPCAAAAGKQAIQ